MDLRTSHKKSLEKFGYKASQVIAAGMQSVVIDNGNGTVTKIYPENINLVNLELLMKFYTSLDISDVQFEIPQIYSVEATDGYYRVIEKRLDGKSINRKELIKNSHSDILAFIRNYIDTLFTIRKLKTNYLGNAQILGHNSSFFIAGQNDWHSMLHKSISKKYQQIGHHFNEDVVEFDRKFNEITNVLLQPYLRNYEVVHGDYSPGNVLVNNSLGINCVLDFSTLTTMGDYLFDIATGWQFIDMYDEVTVVQLKSEALKLIRLRLTALEMKTVYLYVLVYSIVSADMYSRNCDEGHYEWCVKNLNNAEYWSLLLRNV